jgi:hypothetical protein
MMALLLCLRSMKSADCSAGSRHSRMCTSRMRVSMSIGARSSGTIVTQKAKFDGVNNEIWWRFFFLVETHTEYLVCLIKSGSVCTRAHNMKSRCAAHQSTSKHIKAHASFLVAFLQFLRGKISVELRDPYTDGAVCHSKTLRFVVLL